MRYIPDELYKELEKTLRANELTLDGIRAVNEGNYEKAHNLFDESLRINPKHIPTVQWRGICKVLSNDSQGAITDLIAVLDMLKKSGEQTFKYFMDNP